MLALPAGASANVNGVACASSSECWTVGSFETIHHAFLNTVYRWNGKKWVPTSVPNPAGTKRNDFNELDAVACVSASDCWAVGNDAKHGRGRMNQVLRWNGSKWSIVPAPSPGGTTLGEGSFLQGVACVSAKDCWAAGYVDHSAAFLNQALHWNGKKWKLVSTPDPGGDENLIYAITCASARACWAVGYAGGPFQNEALRWNGKAWSAGSPPNPGQSNQLFGVACVSASDCWAVGNAASSTFALNEALQWHAGAWSSVTTPNPAGTAMGDVNDLDAVACVSAKDCWAGGDANGGGGPVNQLLRWNGIQWSAASAPAPSGSVISAIACVSAKDCWAVGDSSGGKQFLHWNGKKWSAK
jgi:hypothetical protein